ncbi:MAG: DNA polymerase III subunit alpha [Candidatus Adiutrix sp.]|jgi:DNA polymerase-3 subunit alpha|nr:DNA polymerase III subunit alpha [Candidatus Adiutrix sp.]
MSFVHLHVHSCYSLLDGAIKVKDLVAAAKKMDMPAVALTDHGQMFGILPFYKAAREAGIKPILGVETYVVADRSRKDQGQGDLRHHLILLAENLAGYRNLCRLVSRANIEGYYYGKPRMDKELLAQYSEGIIALSACLKGEVPWLLLKRGQAEAERAAGEYAAIFKDRFYLEIQHNGLAEQVEANQTLKHLAAKMGLPLVATNDCHYLLKEHYQMHDVLLCIQTGKTVAEDKRMKFSTNEYYFKSPAEMAASFAGEPEALANTLAIAERCQVEFPKPHYAFPALKLAAGESPDDRLAALARAGLEKRLKDMEEGAREVYWQRLELEIALIIKMGFPGYFLIVADFINWAKDSGIPVGPGRGSAAGSLVAYAMSITDVDPIRFGLLFERFLNPERVTMPDIDVDFCTNGRDDVIRYVTDNYGGKEQVAQIVTFGQMKAKGVIRDVGRALGVEYKEADRLAKLVPDKLNITLEQALELEPKLREEAQANPQLAQLLEYARQLENLPRQVSTHASAVVIGDQPLMEHLPLCCDSKTDEVDGEKPQVITQFDMKGVESLGLIKFDFLGLKTLTVIDHCLTFLKDRGLEVDIQGLDLSDEATYALLRRGETTGVFQLESPGMKDYLVKLRPDCIDDLMAMVALYRPGPLNGGMVEKFIDGKHGRVTASYELPQLEPILAETYGVILYQEQVMRISQVLAGFSLGEADLLRRAMGKKNAEEMGRQKERFMEGARANHIDPQKAGHVFELMAKFADYGFNKSHSAAYAIVSFQTAYLKAHYPLEFMAALMTSEKDNQDKVVRLIAECRSAGLQVAPPDVNESGDRFTVVEGGIRFGLGAVKGLGEAAIEAIIAARKEGPFTSLYNFCERVDTQKVNRGVIESLIKCGAFDLSGGADRAVMLAAVDEARESGLRRQRDRRTGQSSMFDLLNQADPDTAQAAWPRVEPWRENVRLAFEKEFLGFFITGHPLARYEMELSVVSSADTGQVKTLADKAAVRLGGVVAKVLVKKDKKGKNYACLTLEDLKGSLEVMVWSDTYTQRADILKPDEVVVVEGQVDAGEKAGQANVKVLARDVLSLTEAVEGRTGTIAFNLPRARLKDSLAFLKTVAQTYPGRTPAFLKLREPDGVAVYKLDAPLKPCRELIESARRHLGPGGLELR